MVKSCCDSYHTQFSDFSAMLSYHEQVRKSSLWERTEVKKLQVAALDKTSPLYEDTDSFDPSVSRDAVEDTAENLKLAIKLRDKFFPCAIPPIRACWTGRRSAAPRCPSSPGRSWPP